MAMSIEELPADALIVEDDDDKSEMSVSEPPDEEPSVGGGGRRKEKRKLLPETPNSDQSSAAKKQPPLESMPAVVIEETSSTCDNGDVSTAPTPKTRTPKGARRKQKPPIAESGATENGTAVEAVPVLKRRPSKKESRAPAEIDDRPRSMSRPNTPRGRAPSPEPEEIKSKLESLVAPLPPPRIPEALNGELLTRIRTPSPPPPPPPPPIDYQPAPPLPPKKGESAKRAPALKEHDRVPLPPPVLPPPPDNGWQQQIQQWQPEPEAAAVEDSNIPNSSISSLFSSSHPPSSASDPTLSQKQEQQRPQSVVQQTDAPPPFVPPPPEVLHNNQSNDRLISSETSQSVDVAQPPIQGTKVDAVATEPVQIEKQLTSFGSAPIDSNLQQPDLIPPAAEKTKLIAEPVVIQELTPQSTASSFDEMQLDIPISLMPVQVAQVVINAKMTNTQSENDLKVQVPNKTNSTPASPYVQQQSQPLVTPHPSQDPDATRSTHSLINSVAKPFIAGSSHLQRDEEGPPSDLNHLQPPPLLQKTKSNDSVASAISLSSSGSECSSVKPQKQQQERHIPGSASPGAIMLSKEKESKVTKAAQYWNNYIGEQIQKSKPVSADNVKSLEKPKKIVSAGVGPRGLDALKNTFEKGKKGKDGNEEKLAITRRNSKKLNLEGCTPGLRVTDATSVFEKKSSLPATPSIFRRNSTNSGQPSKWQQKEESTNNKSTMPFGGTAHNAALIRPEEKKKQVTAKDAKIQLLGSPMSSKEVVQAAVPPPVGQASVSPLAQKLAEPLVTAVQSHIPVLPKVTNGTSDKNSLDKPSLEKEANSLTSPKPKVKRVENSKTKASEEKKAVAKAMISAETSASKSTSKTTSDKMLSSSPIATPATTEKILMPKSQVATKKTDENHQSQPDAQQSPMSPTNDSTTISDNGGDNNSKEAKLAAVGVISREIFKTDQSKTKRTVGSQKTTTASKVEAATKKKADSKSAENAPSSPRPTLKPLKLSPKESDRTAKSGNLIPSTNGTTSSSASKDLISFIPEPPKAPPEPITDEGKQVSVAKVKTIEPLVEESGNKLEAIKSSLKRVPYAPSSRGRASESASSLSPDVQSEKSSDSKSSTPKSSPPMPKVITVIKFDKDGNRLEEKRIEEKPVKFPKTPDTKFVTAGLRSLEQRSPSIMSPPVVTSAKEPQKEPEKEKKVASKSGDSSSRIIPIKVVGVSKQDLVSKKVTEEPVSSLRSKLHSGDGPLTRNIPISLEGGGTLQPPPLSPEAANEAAEGLDSLGRGLSRNRLGSRKKRFSSAYSDSSMSDGEDTFGSGITPLSGLQKYTSLGKHGLLAAAAEERLLRNQSLASGGLQRTDSFSSEEGENDFDDDGFREMTAENLFSTLLTRVKSLTKRIHDEHEQHIHWQKSKRIINHSLNPGGTHARLERNLARNSIKSRGSSGATTPVPFSTQSSIRDDDLVRSPPPPPSLLSLMTSTDSPFWTPSSTFRGTSDSVYSAPAATSSSSTTSAYAASVEPSGPLLSKQQPAAAYTSLSSAGSNMSGFSGGVKRYDPSTKAAAAAVTAATDLTCGIGIGGDGDGGGGSGAALLSGGRVDLDSCRGVELLSSDKSVSVTSKQRLRPGYLPPPHMNINTSDDHSMSAPILMSVGGESLERSRYSHRSPLLSTSSENGAKQRRRVSRFLRPDFYDDPVIADHALGRLSSSIPQAAATDGCQGIGEKKTESSFNNSRVPRPSSVFTPQSSELSVFLVSADIPLSSASAILSSTPSTASSPKTEMMKQQDEARSPTTPSEGQFLSRAISLKKQSILKEPTTPKSPPPSSPPTVAVTLWQPSTETSATFWQPSTETSVTSRHPFPETSATSRQPFPETSAMSRQPSQETLETSQQPSTYMSSSLSSPLLPPAQPPVLKSILHRQQSLPHGHLQQQRLRRQTSHLESRLSFIPPPTFSATTSSPPLSSATLSSLFQPPPPTLSPPPSLSSTRTRNLVSPPPPSSSSSSSAPRRAILPYGGAKSDGLLNKHAFVTCNIIAAAERKKRDSYSRSSTTEILPPPPSTTATDQPPSNTSSS
jgi:hypothetical protein